MRRARRRGEPVLALINVVFLLLIFFLIAGQMARPRPPGLTLATIAAGAPPAAPQTLAVARDGRLFWAGAETETAALPELVGTLGGPLRLMPDRDLPAAELLILARTLGAAGAADIRLTGTRR